ncbi:hypothetical protein AND_003070 [Anopheles darlingi]|uniref:Sok1 kinase belonging to the ste20/sps1/gc kinase family n=1 Tax=Anopheles darlingi TaxID=43151 RepID=W5JQI7_ANODA|nr:hypothetical protein AND_003070 [Anopheles darlingi]
MPDNTRPDAPKPGSSGEQQQQQDNEVKDKERTDGPKKELWDLFEDFQEVGVFLPGFYGEPSKRLAHESLMRLVKTSEDMALAHEIAVNADFELKTPSEVESEDTLHSAVRRTMHTAYWNMVQEELSREPPSFVMAMKILNDVKKAFTVLLRGNNDRTLAKLNEVLDEATIQQQVELGTLDIRGITSYVIELMGKACCMDRDEEVATLKKQTDIVAILRGILETLANMKTDMANYVLHVTRQQVVRSSIAYEKAKFYELKEVSGDNFARTLMWLQRHVPVHTGDPAEQEKPANSEQKTTGQDAAGNNVGMKEIPPPIATAYVALLDSSTKEKDFPELLKLDEGRMHQMRIEALRLSVCATVLQLTVSVIPALVNQPDKRQKLTDRLIVLFDGCYSKQSILEQLEGMWAFVLKNIDEQQPLDTPQATALKYQIGQIATGDSAVHGIISNRLRTLLVAGLIDGDNVPIPGCYQTLRPKVLELTSKLVRITKHNYAVYGDYYAFLINELRRLTPAKESSSA